MRINKNVLTQHCYEIVESIVPIVLLNLFLIQNVKIEENIIDCLCKSNTRIYNPTLLRLQTNREK
jgi:hypothetical protein